MCVENSETPSESANHFVSLLEPLYEHFREIARETYQTLGEEQAGFFVDLANDHLTVQHAILNSYPEDELVSSLVSLYFAGLFKEIYWLELLFLAGNYPMLHRNLRFIWEMVFRAYHVDTYTQQSEDEHEPPEPTIDSKVEWLAQHERRMFRWDRFVSPMLHSLFPQDMGAEVEARYRPLWDRLNEYVHPSKALLDRMVLRESNLLVTDRFDEGWALGTIQVVTMVFDLVWLAILWRFPRSAELIDQKGLHIEYPVVTALLESLQTLDLDSP